MGVNDRIKERRIELKLSLKDVATALGVAESTVSRYETKDIQNMGIDKIEALAKVLECSPGYLMGWEDDNKNLNIKSDDDIERIERAREKMDDDDKENMMKVLEAAFGKYFND